jgi:hypothetical protein
MGYLKARTSTFLAGGALAALSVFWLLQWEKMDEQVREFPEQARAGAAVPVIPKGPVVARKSAPAPAKQAKAKKQPRSPAAQVAASCMDPASYSCTHKIFHPKAASGQFISFDCVESEEWGRRFCLQVQTYSYSSAAAADLPETRPEDLRPGGQFNFEEFHCAHQQVKTATGDYLKAEAKDLSTALLSTVKQCSDEITSRAPGGLEDDDQG